MTQKISRDYGKSELPNRQRTWRDFISKDSDGWDLLKEFEANKGPMLKTKTEGEEAIEQVFSIFRGIIG